MRVLFLTEWFDPLPVQKGISFVAGLRNAGHEIEVATAYPPGPMGAYRRDTMDGITVHRLPLYRSHDKSGLRRSITFLTFFLSALLFGLLRGRRYDVIYAYHPPITVGLAAALFGAVWRRPFVLDMLDLWPDAVTESNMASPKATALINRLCSFVYQRAASISVPAKGFRERLVERGVPRDKITLIYNFADEEKARPSGLLNLDRYRMEGRFNIVYGGNLGTLQKLDAVIEATRIAHQSDPRVQLILVGAGSAADTLKHIAAGISEVVQIYPPVPMSHIGDIFAAADLLVVNLADRPLFRAYLPGKLQFYMAMGKPVLAGLAGEGSDLVREAGNGFVAMPGDPQDMARAILEAMRTDPSELARMGRSGRNFYMASMSSSLATQRLSAMLLEACGKSAQTPLDDDSPY